MPGDVLGQVPEQVRKYEDFQQMVSHSRLTVLWMKERATRVSRERAKNTLNSQTVAHM